MLCVFFKSGHCAKGKSDWFETVRYGIGQLILSCIGNKCKFSHDLNVERKAEKVNLYEDTRDKEKDKKDGEDA